MRSSRETVLHGRNGATAWTISMEVDDDGLYTWMTLDGKGSFGFGGDALPPGGVVNFWYGIRGSGEKIILLRASLECAFVEFHELGSFVKQPLIATGYGVGVIAFFAEKDSVETQVKILSQDNRELHVLGISWL